MVKKIANSFFDFFLANMSVAKRKIRQNGSSINSQDYQNSKFSIQDSASKFRIQDLDSLHHFYVLLKFKSL